jgi:dihydrolipoamide dehydrogenase
MVGAEVTELIQGFAIVMTLETTEEELMCTVFPHPTLSETMHESVMDAWRSTSRLPSAGRPVYCGPRPS